MKKIFLLSVSLLIFSIGYAQVLKYSNEFLNIGIGGRAMAMGGAVVSSTNDVTGAYWNPATLLRMKENLQISAMHNEQFAGIAKHDYGSIGFSLSENSKLALSFVRFGVDGIPNTLYIMQDGQINYSLIRSFSAVDYAFIGSYAKTTKIKGLNIGLNTKIIRRIVGDFGGAWGFGIDLGATYDVKKWQFAAMARDISSTFNAWTFNLSDADKQQLIAAGNAVPAGGLEITVPRFTFGAARKFLLSNDKYSILPEFNLDFTTDGQRNVLISSRFINLDPRIGLELGYNDFVFLRGGYSTLQRVTDITGKQNFNGMPSIGIGIKLNTFSVDYALGNAFNQGLIGMSNIISLKYGINKKN